MKRYYSHLYRIYADTHLPKMSSIRSDIQQYDANITRISGLQQSALNALDERSQKQLALLDGLASETKALGNSLRERLRGLATWPVQGRNAQIRNDQVSLSHGLCCARVFNINVCSWVS